MEDERLMERALECIERHYERYSKEPGYASDVGANQATYIMEDLRKRLNK